MRKRAGKGLAQMAHWSAEPGPQEGKRPFWGEAWGQVTVLLSEFRSAYSSFFCPSSGRLGFLQIPLWEKVVASRVPRMARVQGHSNSPPPPTSWTARTLGSASLIWSQASGPQIAAQVIYSSFKLLAGK